MLLVFITVFNKKRVFYVIVENAMVLLSNGVGAFVCRIKRRCQKPIKEGNKPPCLMPSYL